mmetsp:Transcript_11348/g.20458  ORF Transcript_11348/g.20458 Transcript_11348/m.20458 type:complete len:117 (-) Transcript_11348:249-599(-)
MCTYEICITLLERIAFFSSKTGYDSEVTLHLGIKVMLSGFQSVSSMYKVPHTAQDDMQVVIYPGSLQSQLPGGKCNLLPSSPWLRSILLSLPATNRGFISISHPCLHECLESSMVA